MSISAPTQLDIQKIREAFPVLHQQVNGKPLIYFDNAATSQKPKRVIKKLTEYYEGYNANIHRGIHTLAEKATRAYEDTREAARKFLGAAHTEEIIFTRGVTECINLVASSYGNAFINKGDEIIIAELEHHSNIVPWQMLCEHKGAILKVIPVNDRGEIELDTFKRLLSERTKIVATNHASNSLGTINPIHEIITLAHEKGAVVLIDGAQSIPHMPIDVQALDADFFAFSGHKMIGPTGVGVLYGKRALLEAMPPWMGGGDMISSVRLEGSTWNDLPYKFEAGTPSIAEGIGLGAAVDYLTDIGMDAIHAHEQFITHYALEALSEVPDLKVWGPAVASQKGGVAAFTMAKVHPHDIAELLDKDGIAIRAGHHCAMPLHQKLGLSASARASFYLHTTTAEIDKLVASLHRVRHVFRL